MQRGVRGRYVKIPGYCMEWGTPQFICEVGNFGGKFIGLTFQCQVSSGCRISKKKY